MERVRLVFGWISRTVFSNSNHNVGFPNGSKSKNTSELLEVLCQSVRPKTALFPPDVSFGESLKTDHSQPWAASSGLNVESLRRLV
ncbi:hypothetical protein NHQ30_011522 [Ciborinia camelliae]|nr:hypothetical protein NHQ30_011522 [Ciborinia camelliae]